jgi:hypothetical protein
MNENSDHEVAKDREGREARRTRRIDRAASRFSRFVSSRRFVTSCSKSLRALRDILYGATIYEMVRDLQKERSHREHLFILVVFGDLLGVPILPPYYTLRLLPYVVPEMAGWRRSMLRAKDLTDLCDQEIT